MYKSFKIKTKLYFTLLFIIINLTFTNSLFADNNLFYCTLFTSWFSESCNNDTKTNQNTDTNIRNNEANYNPGTISNPGFVNSFLPSWFTSDNNSIKKENIEEVKTIKTGSKIESAVSSYDFGLKSTDIYKKLLSASEIKAEKVKFEKDVKINNGNNNDKKDYDYTMENYNQKEIDNMSGENSPYHDTFEPTGVVGANGPEKTAVVSTVPDKQIAENVKDFNSQNTFVDKGTGNCTNYGMAVGGSCPDIESYTSQFKITTSRLCALTGKKMIITSGNRSPACNARVGGAKGSSHMSGKAMDTAFSGFSEEEKTVGYLFFVAQGFNNLGGYGANKAVHMDMRSSVNRWGPNYSYTSCQSGRYPDYARKAFALMGLTPCDRNASAVQRAKDALIKMGKQDFAIPANNSGM
jgi:Peptidase M15